MRDNIGLQVFVLPRINSGLSVLNKLQNKQLLLPVKCFNRKISTQFIDFLFVKFYVVVVEPFFSSK